MKTADDPPQDIIQFYNIVFIPAMKDHLLRVCGTHQGAAATAGVAGVTAAAGAVANASIGAVGGGGSTHMSPDISQARGLGSSPRHVSAAGGRDVFVSTCTPNAHLTPRTRTLYAFSDTPANSTSDRLRDINSNINATGPSVAAASALDALAGAANGAAPVGANGHADGGESDVVEPRRAGSTGLNLSGSGVMASGHKRARSLMEPPHVPRSGSSAGSSGDGE